MGKRINVYFEVLLHVIVWGAILSAIYNGVESYWVDLYKTEMKGEWDALQYIAWKKEHAGINPLLFTFTVIIFKILFFYVNVYFIFPSIIRRRWLSTALKVLLNLLLCMLAEYAAFMMLESREGLGTFGLEHYFESDNLITIFTWFAYLLLFSILYWLLRYFILLKRERLSRVSAELALLRNQVNPHFFFNTLNNLYAMAIEKNAPELADSIAQLTHLMRYNIYESRVPHIPLEKESAYIQDYIRLQSLRFADDDNIRIVFDNKDLNPQLPIAPMLLIGFVENAFKHGISLKTHSFIHIRLHTNGNNIHFEVSNIIHYRADAADIKYSGFGLNHTKQLLRWQYPRRHKLEISEENDIFKVTLTVTV